MPMPSFPIENVGYRVQPKGGTDKDKKFLSCTEDGETVDLYNEVDPENPGRQNWLFTKVRDNVYHIKPAGNVYNDKTFLSCSDDGETVDLYGQDDGSGRQQWILTPNIVGWFQIKVVGGIDDERKILSCTRGGKVDLNYTEDGSGRQQWLLLPEDIELAQVEFNTKELVNAARPAFIDNVTLENKSSVQQQMTAHFSRRASETSTFQEETSFGWKVTSTATAGQKDVASVSFSVEISGGKKWTYGKSETKEDTRSYDFPVVVPPNKTVDAQVKVAMRQVDIPYTAWGISKMTGGRIEVKGIWRGVLAGDIETSYQERGAYLDKTAAGIDAANSVYRIQPAGGVGERNILSCGQDGVVNLSDQGMSDRQRWILEQVSTGVYRIKSRETNGGRNYLSCSADGSLVDLFTTDDNSGRQQWKVTPINDGVFTIEASAGVGERKYLSCSPDGTKVDLWKLDDGSGRQRWRMTRI